METKMSPTSSAIERLKEGNQRFLAAGGAAESLAEPTPLSDLAGGQAPFAAILGCADSRVAPEIVFDAQLGQLFTIRVAGHVAGPNEIGSLEYAVDHLGVELIVVLGHSSCGAVAATLQAVKQPGQALSAALTSIVDEIRPAIDRGSDATSEDQKIGNAVRSHVRATVTRLGERSPVLHRAAASGKLTIIGAEYSLDRGTVEFLEGS